MTKILIRHFQGDEGDALGRILHRAVHHGTTAFYTAAQRSAWCPHPPSGADWSARLAGATTLVAHAHRQPVGFLALDATGHLDLAYIDPDFARRGIAGMLLGVLDRSARKRGLPRLTTHASAAARPFFLSRGWSDGPA